MASTGRCTGFCLDASAGGCVLSATGCPTTGCPTGGCPAGARAALSCFDFGVLLALRLRVLVEEPRRTGAGGRLAWRNRRFARRQAAVILADNVGLAKTWLVAHTPVQ